MSKEEDFNTYYSCLSFEEDVLNDKKIICICFNRNYKVVKWLKTLVNPIWDAKLLRWYVYDTSFTRSALKLDSKFGGKRLVSKIDPINLEAFRLYQNELILKGFSKNTIRTYTVEFAQLLYLIKAVSVNSLDEDKLKSYFLYCMTDLGLSENQVHSRMNAVKFYFVNILGRQKFFVDIPRPKKPYLLPKALNEKDIKLMIKLTDNIKHRLVIKLCYGMGLRVSEIVNLKIEDIDGEKLRVLIARAKGKKDRYVNLPKSILEELRTYYKEYRPSIYLFEGMDKGQYTVRSAQSVFKQAMKRANINKNVGIHSLRHSYATHLLEYGTDIALIQKLLGHNNIKTTLIYTEVTDKNISNVVSPLDRMED